MSYAESEFGDELSEFFAPKELQGIIIIANYCYIPQAGHYMASTPGADEGDDRRQREQGN